LDLTFVLSFVFALFSIPEEYVFYFTLWGAAIVGGLVVSVLVFMVLHYWSEQPLRQVKFDLAVKDYFLVRGSLATILTVFEILLLPAMILEMDFTSYVVTASMSAFIVIVIFLGLIFIFHRAFESIDNDFELLIAATICTFVSVEAYNILVMVSSGGSYLTFPFTDFIINKMISLGVAASANLIVRLVLTKQPLVLKG